jgi:hypothetical protein
MSRFIKQLLFGDTRSWRQAQKSENGSLRQRKNIRKNIPASLQSENDLEQRIIQLEIIAGSLLGIIRENDLINEDELKNILNLAESEATLALHPRKKRVKKYPYHS